MTTPPCQLLRPKILAFLPSSPFLTPYTNPVGPTFCMSYPESCHPGPGHHHFLPGLFQKFSNCLEDISQLPSLLLYSSLSTRQPKGLFKMKQHHFNLYSKFSSGFASHSESMLKSPRSPTSRTSCGPTHLLHHSSPSPMSCFTPHSTMTFSIFLPNTRHTLIICYTLTFYMFSIYCPLPTRI